CSAVVAPALAELHTPSLHDALPIFETEKAPEGAWGDSGASGEYEKGGFVSLLSFLRNETEEETIEYLVSKYGTQGSDGKIVLRRDRKSTRLNSSHVKISYAVFCLKK